MGTKRGNEIDPSSVLNIYVSPLPHDHHTTTTTFPLMKCDTHSLSFSLDVLLLSNSENHPQGEEDEEEDEEEAARNVRKQ